MCFVVFSGLRSIDFRDRKIIIFLENYPMMEDWKYSIFVRTLGLPAGPDCGVYGLYAERMRCVI